MSDYIYFHTCKQEGGVTTVEANAPFRSEGEIIPYSNGKRKIPFFGKGCYFWDETDELIFSKDWGEKHCNNKYYVVECEINSCDESGKCKLLDLVGNAEHKKFFRLKLKMVVDTFKRSMKESDIKIGFAVEFLKNLDNANNTEEHMPFNIARIRDDSYKPSGKQFYFSEYQPQYSVFTKEKWIVCLMKQKSIHLRNRRVVYANPPIS